MDPTTFISALVKIYKPERYLELGVGRGATLRAVINLGVPSIHGVDKDLPVLGGPVVLHEMDVIEFLEKHTTRFDMIYIDADPREEVIKTTYIHCIRLLRPGGCIVMHDTDPISEELLAHDKCGEACKLVPTLEACQRMNIVTLPLGDAGVITRKGEQRRARSQS